MARFGLFLQELLLVQRAKLAPSSGLSLWFDTALIAIGVAVTLSSAPTHSSKNTSSKNTPGFSSLGHRHVAHSRSCGASIIIKEMLRVHSFDVITHRHFYGADFERIRPGFRELSGRG